MCPTLWVGLSVMMMMLAPTFTRYRMGHKLSLDGCLHTRMRKNGLNYAEGTLTCATRAADARVRIKVACHAGEPSRHPLHLRRRIGHESSKRPRGVADRCHPTVPPGPPLPQKWIRPAPPFPPPTTAGTGVTAPVPTAFPPDPPAPTPPPDWSGSPPWPRHTPPHPRRARTSRRETPQSARSAPNLRQTRRTAGRSSAHTSSAGRRHDPTSSGGARLRRRPPIVLPDPDEASRRRS